IGTLSNPNVGITEGLLTPDANALGASLGKNLVRVVPIDQTHSNVYYWHDNPTGDDFAKQLLVLLGTLVTSVASFYFGSQAVTSAVAATQAALSGNGTLATKKANPSIKSISPTTRKNDGTTASLTIDGSNLGSV